MLSIMASRRLCRSGWPDNLQKENMNKTVVVLGALCAVSTTRFACAEPALTIYNQNFAVVRDSVALDLKAGSNRVAVSDLTAHLEPDSVVLRDPSGKRQLQILEQNFRSDPISQELLLSLNEGKTIDFLVVKGDKTEIVKGKIVRSNYVPHRAGLQRYGQQYYGQQMSLAYGGGGQVSQPIIEVDGQLRFGLPGTPLFPNLPGETILKPTLNWLIDSDKAGALNAELAYVTGGMTWEADYNAVASEKGDTIDLTGWVTMDNQSGKSFENAKIKLMAGDVSKIKPDDNGTYFARANNALTMSSDGSPNVTQKAFDDYHLYTLERATTLLDRETKQVEMIRAANIKTKRIYIYDGVKIDSRYNGYSYDSIRTQSEYGTQSNPKVWVMREFVNSAANGLGVPLPKGRMRFYRRDSSTRSGDISMNADVKSADAKSAENGAIEFTGENVIDHTPQGETVRVYTGDAFDIVGERKRTLYKQDPQEGKWVDETFAITLRNRKVEAAEVRVVEHLYRWTNWAIKTPSNPFVKTDAQTAEFRVQLKPNEVKTITYTVHYSW